MPARRRLELREAGRQIAAASLAAGRTARRAGAEPAPERRAAGFDPKTRNARLARWFAPHVRRELEELRHRIEAVRADDAELGDGLLAALSAILYKVSSRASDTDATWVERHIARGNPTRLFAQRVELLVAGLDDLARTPAPPPRVLEGDARELASLVGARSAWAVITSPPYAGTYDYAEHQRLRFDFLGLRHRAMDAGELGARRGFDADARRAHAQWRAGLTEVLTAIAAVLAPGRPAALVIGDSLAAGRAVYALDELAACGDGVLELVGAASQARPQLGALERAAFAARPKQEHVVLLRAVGDDARPSRAAGRTPPSTEAAAARGPRPPRRR
ncbi:MAG: hypothetical protein R2939_00515 [Kofleriaceae bacterium]